MGRSVQVTTGLKDTIVYVVEEEPEMSLYDICDDFVVSIISARFILNKDGIRPLKKAYIYRYFNHCANCEI